MPILMLALAVCLTPLTPLRSNASSGDNLVELEALWNSSLNNLGGPISGLRPHLWIDWIESARKLSIASPQAHFNLGNVYLIKKDYGASVVHILKSIALKSSPKRIWEDLELLSSIQREIGITNAVSSDFMLRLPLLINYDVSILLALLGFWVFVGVVFGIWFRILKSRYIQSLCISMAAFFFAVVILGYVLPKYMFHYGVLDNGRASVLVFATPTHKANDDTLELPSGTLVALGNTEGQWHQIIAPTIGWVEKAHLNFVGSP